MQTDKQQSAVDGDLIAQLRKLHDEARGATFDLRPADGPIARLALFMHENGDKLLPTIAAAEAREAEKDATIARLEHLVDRDRYIVAAALGHIRKALDGHRWLLEGRGPDEFTAWLEQVEAATGALAKLAWDKSGCTTDPLKVQAARDAARAFCIDAPKGHRDMLPSDIGLPCPSCATHARTITREAEKDATIARLQHIAHDLLQHIDWLTCGLPEMLEKAALTDEEGLIGAAVDAANDARAALGEQP